MSKVWNNKIFKHIQTNVDEASKKLAEERGSCPDAEEYGLKKDFQIKQLLLQQLLFQ